jgi:hypothetical protein
MLSVMAKLVLEIILFSLITRSQFICKNFMVVYEQLADCHCLMVFVKCYVLECGF